MKYNIILRNGRYALLEMETQYVVACGFDETLPEGSQWTQGYYYTHWNDSEIVKQRMLLAALEHYRTLTETDYIPRCREEINEILDTLPTEIEVPNYLGDDEDEFLDNVSDWLSDEFGFCHDGFELVD